MITLNINGIERRVDVEADTPLLWVLRDTLRPTGTKYGCGQALRGACTMHLDGVPVRSCSLPVSAAAGRQFDVVQCGYCQSGQMMSAVVSLSQNRQPSRCRHRCRDGGQPVSLRHLPLPPAGAWASLGAARREA